MHQGADVGQGEPHCPEDLQGLDLLGIYQMGIPAM
jgi:hypothetical protein